jgi:hypothetical protein
MEIVSAEDADTCFGQCKAVEDNNCMWLSSDETDGFYGLYLTCDEFDTSNCQNGGVVTVARDDDGTDKCNFCYCLPGVLPGVPKKVPIGNRACDDLDGPDFSGCEYGRLVLAWLLL